MAIEHVPTCHRVTKLSSITLLRTSGRIFKYRCVLILGRKMSDCKSEQLNIKFLVKLKKFGMETSQLLTGLTVKITCLMHVCLNDANDFRKAEKV